MSWKHTGACGQVSVGRGPRAGVRGQRAEVQGHSFMDKGPGTQMVSRDEDPGAEVRGQRSR